MNVKKIVSVLAVLLIAAFGVGCDEEEATEPAAEADPAQADGAGVDGDFEYPGFDLDQLDDGERAELAEMAHMELCPCEGSTESLHECMQQQQRCDEADEELGALVDVVAEADDGRDAFARRAEQRVETGGQHDFDLRHSPYRGDREADVIVVEFADFLCPHCRTAAGAVEQVYREFGDDVGIFFKNFPVGGQVAEQAARAAMAAHQQGRFWEMHGLMFDNQSQLDRTMINDFARQLGLNYERFQQDMESEEIAALVAADREDGMNAGVSGTPTIFINGERYDGALSGEAMNAKVASLLDDE